MNNYNQNLQYIKRYSEELYRDIHKNSPIDSYTIHKTDDHENVYVEAISSKCYLHSLYDIQREIQMTYRHIPSDVEVLILFGVGMGHGLEQLKNRYNKLQRLVLIEPNQDVFKMFLKKHKLSDLFSTIGEVSFIVNRTATDVTGVLSGILIEIGSAKLDIVYTMSYRSLYNEYFDEIHQNVINTMRLNLVNFATSYTYKYLWISNMFRNFKREAIKSERVEPLFNGKPVILVSAGPSLNKNMHLLKEVYDKAFIVAVGSAIRILDSNGIRPHFRFAIDGSPGQKRIFANLNENDVPLISSAMHSYEVQNDYMGGLVRIIMNSDFLMHYIYNKSNIAYQAYETGFSVANVALNFLVNNGCSKIIFMGQDLSFTGGEIYARGSWSNEQVGDFSTNNFIKTKDIFGNDIYTDRQHYSMKIMIETVIAGNLGDIEFINATEGGVNLEHAVNKSLRNVIDEDLKDSSILSEKVTLEQLLSDTPHDTSIDDSIRELRVENSDLLASIDEFLTLAIDYKSNFEEIMHDGYSGKKKASELKDKYSRLLNMPYYELMVKQYLVQDIYSVERKFGIMNKNKQNLKGQFDVDLHLELITAIKQFADVIDNLVKEYFDEQKFTIIFE